jgi:hypothetical protein
VAPRSTKSGKWSISQFNLNEDQRQPWLGLCVRNLGENVHSGSPVSAGRFWCLVFDGALNSARTKIPPRGGESRRDLLRQDVVRGAEEN